jgi:hypothetical protein
MLILNINGFLVKRETSTPRDFFAQNSIAIDKRPRPQGFGRLASGEQKEAKARKSREQAIRQMARIEEQRKAQATKRK